MTSKLIIKYNYIISNLIKYESCFANLGDILALVQYKYILYFLVFFIMTYSRVQEFVMLDCNIPTTIQVKHIHDLLQISLFLGIYYIKCTIINGSY